MGLDYSLSEQPGVYPHWDSHEQGNKTSREIYNAVYAEVLMRERPLSRDRPAHHRPHILVSHDKRVAGHDEYEQPNKRADPIRFLHDWEYRRQYRYGWDKKRDVEKPPQKYKSHNAEHKQERIAGDRSNGWDNDPSEPL